MRITNVDHLKKLKKGDLVYATFSDIQGDVVECHGQVEEVKDSSILLREESTSQVNEYQMWRMLSLVCMERDISYVREGNIMSDLEHITQALDGRIRQGGSQKRGRSPKNPRRR